MATKLKSYFTRKGSKTDMVREEGVAEEKQPSTVLRVTSTSEPSSPQPLTGESAQVQMEREMDREREDSPLRCWTTERNKCLQGLELNSRNYYSVPLEVTHRHYPSLPLSLLNSYHCVLKYLTQASIPALKYTYFPLHPHPHPYPRDLC